MSISREKWDSLSKAERDLAGRLGIKPEAVKKAAGNGAGSGGISPEEASKPKVSAIQPYILGIIVECRLCSSTTVTMYQMKKAGTAQRPALESLKFPESTDVKPNRWEYRYTSVCTGCRDELKQWPKDRVINQLITDRLSVKRK